MAPSGAAAAYRCGALVCPVHLTPFADQLVLPEASRRLLTQIRVASLDHFERAHRFDRLRVAAVALPLPGVAIAVLLFPVGLAVLFGLSAAAVGAYHAWRSRAIHHGVIADLLFALGRDLYRSGPTLTPARLCLFQVRVDLLVATSPSGWPELISPGVARALAALCLRGGRGRGAASQTVR